MAEPCIANQGKAATEPCITDLYILPRGPGVIVAPTLAVRGVGGPHRFEFEAGVARADGFAKQTVHLPNALANPVGRHHAHQHLRTVEKVAGGALAVRGQTGWLALVPFVRE